MAQVKFYSVAADATRSDANGIYFVTGGELYKGTSRFGLGRVTTVESVATLTSAARGDININGGVTKVFDGTNWVVAASAFTLPDFTTGDADGQVKLGSVNATVSGWSGLVESVGANATAIAGLSTTVGNLSTRVGTLETKVSGIEDIVNTANGGTVTASSATFTDLTVTDTATFTATTVAATTLTVGGSDISELISAGADARITAAKLSGNIAASKGAGLVNEGQVVTYVSAAIQSFDNAMHYIGTTSDANIVQDATAVPSDISGYTSGKRKSGDIVIKGTQEFIWNGSKWELIGDQGTYATKAELSASWSTLGTAAFKDYADAVTADATTLPTCSAVASYVTGAVNALSSTVTFSDKGISGNVVQTSGKLVSASIAVNTSTLVSQMIYSDYTLGDAALKSAVTELLSDSGNLPTESAVAAYVSTYVASAISDAALVWLDANGDAIS